MIKTKKKKGRDRAAANGKDAQKYFHAVCAIDAGRVHHQVHRPLCRGHLLLLQIHRSGQRLLRAFPIMSKRFRTPRSAARSGSHWASQPCPPFSSTCWPLPSRCCSRGASRAPMYSAPYSLCRISSAASCWATSGRSSSTARCRWSNSRCRSSTRRPAAGGSSS